MTDTLEPRVLTEVSHDLPMVNVSASLMSGSLSDPQGKEGLVEITLRMMRRNAAGRSADENDQLVDGIGGSLGAHVSTSTSGLGGTVIARMYPAFEQLLQETLSEPVFSEEEFERLKRETLAEMIESLDNDRALARRWFRRRFFAEHPYGRPTGGTKRSLAAITLDDVKSMHRLLVTPNNLVFAFAGDLAEQSASASAKRMSQALPVTSSPLPEAPAPVGPRGRHLVLVDKPERTQTQILIGGLGTHPKDDDHVALLVANTIFGGTFTARLTQEVRAKRGWSYGAYSSLPFDRQRRTFSMWTFPKATDAAPCVKLQLDLLQAWHERGITRKELAWAKRYLRRSDAFSHDTAAKRVGLRLDTATYNLPSDYYAGMNQHIAQVSLEEVNASIQKRIFPDDLLIVVVGTADEIREPLRGAIAKLASDETVPFDVFE